METTGQDKDRLRTIISKLISGDKQWFKQMNIIVGDKNPYWILNYLPGPRNEFNSLVRGLVVRKPDQGFNGDLLQLITSFPFTRFFNFGEKEAEQVDFANAEMLEKMDGTMVACFFPNGDPAKPEYQTRKMLSTHQPDQQMQLTTFAGETVDFMPIIGKYVRNLRFSQEDVLFTYVFEFLHSASYVLTKYTPEQYGLYLLGGRNVQNHRELAENELDAIAQRIGAKRPRRFDTIADHSQIAQMFDLAGTQDFEGFVFRDKTTGKRVKVKDPRYVEKHHLIGDLSYKNLVPLILKGEEEEIVAYFPAAQSRIDEIKAAYSKYFNELVEKVEHWGSQNLDRKTLALSMTEPDKFARSMIFRHSTIQGKELRQQLKQELEKIALGTGKNEGSPKRFIELIGLHDEENEAISGGVGEL